jgi:hypothetical protein
MKRAKDFGGVMFDMPHGECRHSGNQGENFGSHAGTGRQ